MSLDIGAAILAVVLTGLGYYSGALKQMTRVIGVMVAFFAAPFVAAILRDILVEKTAGRDGFAFSQIPDWPLLLAGGALVYGVVALLSFLAIRLLRATSDELTRADRGVGGGLGFAKALLIIYAATSVILLFEANIRRGDPDDKLMLRDSYVSKAVAAYPDGWAWVASTVDLGDPAPPRRSPAPGEDSAGGLEL